SSTAGHTAGSGPMPAPSAGSASTTARTSAPTAGRTQVKKRKRKQILVTPLSKSSLKARLAAHSAIIPALWKA
ncbi:zinc finger protein 500, partial [Homo sapiens]